ncbi:hypothetical protein [Polyangium aurulentum]|uniref:hypothetical protein n=1 Tax=Polyangium aurulentum TaxID=2567896 RepID=UPI0010ADACE0|nr:hypothetical protein [Polyangium aurulentum]UQA62014.1 hypothetical protein E8A73_016680 [Polyangium aurulentum]
MFRVRREQLDWFADKARRDFVGRMVGYLEEHYHDWVEEMSREDLSAWVSAATSKAERFKVVTEPEVAQLILLYLLLGVDADEEHPWVKETLTDRDLSGVGKVRKLVALARSYEIEGIDEVVLAEHDDPPGEEAMG